ncbi:MAG: PLDc N-terminal domain-containing protein [Actinomycetota bacterium]|nr:PLDc N-terminal domain-containing protein [Actinomycetota bacterium]
MAAVGGAEWLIILAALGVLGFWLAMLFEIATRPDWVYAQAGESKAIWFIVVLVLQFFGTLGYFFMRRDKLRRVEAADRSSHLSSDT